VELSAKQSVCLLDLFFSITKQEQLTFLIERVIDLFDNSLSDILSQMWPIKILICLFN